MSIATLAPVAREAAAALNLCLGDFCGKGAFKETFCSRNSKGERFALKLVDRQKINLDRTEREIEALRKCHTTRVAKLFRHEVFRSSSGCVFDVVLEEYLDGGSLADVLQARSLSVDQARELARGLILAIRELNLLQLVHRDIKPANVMFRKNDPTPVLVDFGLVRDLSQASLTATWALHGPGTPFYAPPEQLNNEKSMIGWRADQFSVGVLIYQSVTRRHPYARNEPAAGNCVHYVSQRQGPSPEFVAEANSLGLRWLVPMVQPWPVQRFPHPDDLLSAIDE